MLCQHDDGDRGVGIAHTFHQVQTATVLQHQIRKHDMYGSVLQNFQSFVSRGHGDGLHPGLLGYRQAHFPDTRFVIDDQMLITADSRETATSSPMASKVWPPPLENSEHPWCHFRTPRLCTKLE
jgi:hypothetical protein